MSKRTTLILFLLSVGITPLVWLNVEDRLYHFQKDLDQPFDDRMHGFLKLEIEQEGKPRIVCEKTSEGWRLTHPLRFPASSARVQDGLCFQLRELRVRGKGGSELARYGLDHPPLRVTFHTTRGAHTILFGDEHPSLPYVYAWVENEVVLCDQTLRDNFQSVTVDLLRDDTICGINSYRAGHVAVQGRQHEVELGRTNGIWTVLGALTSDAEPGEVRQLVDVLNSWAIDDYVADDVDPAAPDLPFGLDDPRYRVVISDQSGNTAKILIGEAGAPDPEGRERVYLCREGERHVFLASAEPLVLLDQRADHYRSRGLFFLPEPEVQRLEIRAHPEGQRARRLVISGDEQQLSAITDDGDRFDVDPSWFRQLTELLRAAQVSRFLPADRDNIQRYGFDAPVLVIGITPKEGPEQSLIVGANVSDRPRERYVHRKGMDYFATVPLGVEEVLLGIPWTLRSEHVHSVGLDRLNRFRLEKPGFDGVTFVRPHRTWRLEGRAEIELDKPTVDTVAGALAAIRATRWEPLAGSSPGPDSFAMRIDLLPTEDEPRTFWVGPREGKERRVVEGDGPWSFICRLEDDAPLDPFQLMEELLDQVQAAK